MTYLKLSFHHSVIRFYTIFLELYSHSSVLKVRRKDNIAMRIKGNRTETPALFCDKNINNFMLAISLMQVYQK